MPNVAVLQQSMSAITISNDDPKPCYASSYPIKGTQDIIRDELEKKGLRRTLGRDPHCIFQWTKFSSIKWDGVLQGSCIASSFTNHKGLENKAELTKAINAFCEHFEERKETSLKDTTAGGALDFCKYAASLKLSYPKTVIVNSFTKIENIIKFCFNENNPKAQWVVKSSRENNALGVRIVNSPETLRTALQGSVYTNDNDVVECAEKNVVVVQEYISRPLLVNHRKFHLRVNVLAIGRLAVFVHRCYVAHVASEPFPILDSNVSSSDDDETERPSESSIFAHVTNHVIQRSHPSFASELNTYTVPKLMKELVKSGHTAIQEKWNDVNKQIDDIVGGCFLAALFDPKRVMSGTSGKKEEVKNNKAVAAVTQPRLRSSVRLFPLVNTFEIFGFDFLIEETKRSPAPSSTRPWVVKLLEINEGPALEGHCCPSVCRKIVQDTLQIVLDPILVPLHKSFINEHAKSNSENGVDGGSDGSQSLTPSVNDIIIPKNYKQVLRLDHQLQPNMKSETTFWHKDFVSVVCRKIMTNK
eukprot:g766.t1